MQLTEQVLGVSPVDPGYTTWSIKPHTGLLAWARGLVPTRSGDIDVSWSKGRSFQLHSRTPSGTSGVIAVPATSGSIVLVDGHVAWYRGHSRAHQASLVDGYVQLSLPGGRHDIVVI